MRYKLRMRWGRWKNLKWRERLLWLCGLRTFDYAHGFSKSLWWIMDRAVLESKFQARLREAEKRRDAEVNEWKRKLSEVVPKLVRLSLDRSATMERFRLVLDMDPFMIREAFEFGNDNWMMEYFSEYVGHMVYRELKTMNMQRFREYPFRDYHPVTGRRIEP